MISIQATVLGKKGTTELNATVNDLVVAGWTGRDKEAMEHHILELEALGIERPKSTPVFYRVSASRLTHLECIEVTGNNSSGEAEAVLLAHNNQVYVGLGSDHTDRKVETFNITASKQICEKPIASTFWPLEEVSDHWDSLVLRSYMTIDGTRRLYQEGTTEGLLNPLTLVDIYTNGKGLPDGTLMFCGTLPALGGIEIGSEFECSLEDPVLAREIDLRYTLKVLPD